MFSRKYFIHNFDAKIHYLEYYSKLQLHVTDKFHINDSVQQNKCNRRLGRWNFFVADKDYSCGVYHALEVIRQSIFSAKENNKNCVDIAIVPTLHNPDVCNVFNHDKGLKDILYISFNKKNKFKNKCECDTKVPKQIFFKIIKPALEELFKKTDYKLTMKNVKDKKILERSGAFLISFKQDINIIRVEWCADKLFNDHDLQSTMELQFA